MSNINLGRIVPIFKGNYEGSVTYEKLDIVYFNGCSWVATGTTVGEQPSEESTSWVKVSAQGEKVRRVMMVRMVKMLQFMRMDLVLI